jgi:glutathione peroxidase
MKDAMLASVHDSLRWHLELSRHVEKGALPMYSPTVAGAMMLLGSLLITTSPTLGRAGEKTVYDFSMKSIAGDTIPLSRYRGKVLLLVNVASRCGFTPQYKDLEALYRKYQDRGFAILAFPANNFRGQEPGTDAEIKEFCTLNYGVTFPMFSKISVKGEDQHPLYRYLTSGEANPSTSGEVQWNFQKYLVGRDGKVLAKFLSRVKPFSEELTAALENALAAKQ